MQLGFTMKSYLAGPGGGGGNQDQKYSIVATLMREEKSIGILEME